MPRLVGSPRFSGPPPLLGLPRIGVDPRARAPLLGFMLEGLREAGCAILCDSGPDAAPFVIVAETPDGERLGIVAYAFTANRKVTGGRPSDERRFQVKYGAKPADPAANEHVLWRDPLGLFTTLFVGIDVDEGFFVSADPVMHSPTKFFISVEFKDRHADAIKRDGWLAWERHHRGDMPEPTETLLGGTRQRFLDLVRFERAAEELPPGDRHLLAERLELFAGAAALVAGATESEAALHPLVAELELAPEGILELIAGARRLKMAVRGWVAEEKLRETLAATPGVTWCERLDEEGGPDLRVRWQDGPPLTIECKNVLRQPDAAGRPKIDFQRTRASKADPCSRYYAATDFDVVAGCLHAVSERWEFRYVRPAALDPHLKCPGKLASNVKVGSLWTADPGAVLAVASAGLG